MISSRNPAIWTGPVIGFIARNLPVLDPEAKEWDHMCATAYQFGCEALIALGQAEETTRGARPLPHPRLPERLPRWDDICVTVLSLAHQCDMLSYRLPNGRESHEAAAWRGRRSGTIMLPPNIAAAHGLGPAYAAPELMPVLGALGLVEHDRWTAAAELVLWREQPEAWQMDIAADPRFRAAVDQACTVMPEDIRTELTRLTTITGADVTEGLARRRTWQQQAQTGHAPNPVIHLPLTRDSVRQGLTFTRRHDLDWLFFNNWRMTASWITPEERQRALPIFHDPLAIMMRREVVKRLWPERTEMVE